MHRRRGHFIRRHTGAINALRGHLAEFGLVSAGQRAELNHLLMLVEDGGNAVPGEVAELLGMITSEIRGYDQSIAEFDKRLKELCKDADVSRRLRAVPGMGPVREYPRLCVSDSPPALRMHLLRTVHPDMG